MKTDYTENIIKTESLTYAYKPAEGELPKIVLNGIDLEIEKGTFVAVLGHNGSGKTTLAKHFNAILLPMGGRVFVRGMDTRDENMLMDIRRCVCMVFQNPDNQIVANVVEEDVAFAPENLGYPSDEIRRRVDEALKTVGMYEYREHAPHLLSGGQKQRIAIAGVRPWSPNARFRRADGNARSKGQESIIGIIRRLRDSRKVTIVLITHHMDETIDADRLIVMSDGVILMDGKPREVFKKVESLRATGLDVPETVGLLYELNQCGFELKLDALSVEECAQEIYSALK